MCLELGSLSNERPHGGLPPRLTGTFPGIGVAGGWLDERGAIHKAAKQATRLVT